MKKNIKITLVKLFNSGLPRRRQKGSSPEGHKVRTIMVAILKVHSKQVL